MRKNMIFCMIGFALVLVTGGHAFAETGDISMGVISIPLPSNGVDGKDGCAPLIRSTEKDANNCYEIQQNVQTWDDNNKVCTPVVDGGSNQVWTKITEVCDGAVNMTKEYVPYPASTFSGTEPQNEGYIKVTIPAADDNEDDTILKYPDYCEEFYEDGLTKKKCIAQDNAVGVNWPNADGTHNPYQQGDTYVFSVDTLESGYPRYEYTAPRLSGGTSGYPVAAGFTQMVYVYDNGRRVTETGATDECKEYAKPDNLSARVTKCTVQSYQYPENLLSTWVPGTTKYCLGNHVSDCDQYTILIGAVETCAGLTSADSEWNTTVNRSESEYVERVYPVGGGTCTTNCTGTVGYKLTKEEMCSGAINVSTNPDECEYATAAGVTCATGYAYQKCTPQMVTSGSTVNPYYGCFPDTLSDFARRSDIVPANFASDGTNLYWCQIPDCDNTPACWIDGDKLNGPNSGGQVNSTNCWGVVSIDGLQGDAGPGCSFYYDGTNWKMCCWPVVNGVVMTTQNPTCNNVTGDLANQLSDWMCKPTYTTYYIDKVCSGDNCTYSYNRATANNSRTDATVGIRTTITNCDGSNGGDVDVYDGEPGDPGQDYDPCNGVSGADALSRIHHETSVYISHGTSNSATTTTGIGYYKRTNVMCNQSGNEDVYQYDSCQIVADARIAREAGALAISTCAANQTLLQCKSQETPFDVYYICENAEVSQYPKKVYVAPQLSDNKLIKPGYTKWVHKFTSNGSEVIERKDPDQCYKVYKQNLVISNDNTKTATTTTTSVLKCTVQEYPDAASPWTVGYEYCLNTDNSGSCEGYSNEITTQQTHTLKYHLPEMDGDGKPVAPGYAYTEVSVGGSVLYVTEPVPDICNNNLVSRTTSGDTTTTTGVTKCVVRAPGGGTGSTYYTGHEYCLNYANGTCPVGLVDVGSAIDSAESDPCASLPANATDADKKALIKKTTRLYTEPAGDGTIKTAAGFTTFTRETCLSGEFVTDKEEDICNPVSPANAMDCPNGVYYACSNPNYDSGNTYYYCDTSTNNLLLSSCANVNESDKPVTVQKVLNRQYMRTEGSQGALISTYRMCDDSDHSETTLDECYEIPTPAGETCTNGVWMQCKRQADEGTASATARGTTYGYCAVYPQCVENPSSSTVVRNTQRSYTGPQKTNSADAYYTTVGKMTDVKIACNGATISTDESAEDQCEEVADSSTPVCPTDAKVRKTCKRQGKVGNDATESTYTLCTTGLSISAAQSAAEENDPCGGDTTSDDAKKKVKNIEYEYVARNATGNTSKVGYSKKTTTMCNTAGNTTEYIYDTCVSVAAASGCNGTNDKNYKCYNQTQPATASASAREYNTCNPSESAVALSSAVANKLDSDVTFAIKPNSQDSNKEYITITGSNITDKPMVALESLQGQSVFDIWKAEQTDSEKCDALFGKRCDELVASDMLLDLSAQGNWARNTYETSSDPSALSHSDLGATQFQNSLKPCQQFGISENPSYDGSQGDGKQYIMTCIE